MWKRNLAVAFCAAMVAMAPGPAAEAGTQYFYDSAGRLIRVRYSNGVVIEYQYDASGNRRQIVTQQVPNQPPVANNDTATVPALGTIDIAVRNNDSDPESDPLTITSVSSPPSGGGTTSIVSGKIRYVAPATTGARTFNYTISDGQGHTDTATVTVTVTSNNQPPVANNDTAVTSPATTTPIMVLANDTDPNGNTLTVTAVSAPTAGTVTIAPGGGHVIYTAPLLGGIRTFTYTVGDGAGGTDTATVTVTVQTNEGPGGCTPPPGQLICVQD